MSKNKDDRMKSFLKGRLEDYRHPVKGDLWTSIEKEIPAKPGRRNKSALLLIALTGSAAVLAFGIVIYRNLTNSPDTVSVIAEMNDVKKDGHGVEPDIISEVSVTVTDSIHNGNDVSKTTGLLIARQDNNNNSQPEISASLIDETLDAKPESVEKPTESTTNENATPNINRNQANYRDMWPEEKPTRKQNGNNMSIALAINGTPSDNASNNSNRGYGGGNPGGPSTERVKTKNKYDFPVTASVMLRYNLTSRFSLESGLGYTMLSAKSEVIVENILESNSYYKLHYLGIPLRATISIYDNRWSSVYGSVGVIAEKLVSGKGETKMPGMAATYEDITTSRFMWSVSSVVGVSYKLNNIWGIFVEPGIGYSFDDGVDAPTIRRERPLNFNIQAGVRINLK